MADDVRFSLRRNKTLGGNRAERNEYILLHRFNEKGYICPDKISSWEKKAQIAAEAEAAKAKAKAAGEEAPKVVQTKKKFTGGLVFEPTKGLWDRYILVMDFNSLYPSIIQEYDIDFSTIDWTADGVSLDLGLPSSRAPPADASLGISLVQADDIEKMPERAPCQGEPVGILPQLIASLVSRRRNVKGLMKDRSITAGKRKQVRRAHALQAPNVLADASRTCSTTLRSRRSSSPPTRCTDVSDTRDHGSTLCPLPRSPLSRVARFSRAPKRMPRRSI